MIVCICNRYKDTEIRAAARAGESCPQAIYRSLGGEARCGRCLEYAEAVIAEVRSDAPQPINALAASG